MALIDSSAGREVPIPHEPGQSMTFRSLNFTELALAKRQKFIEMARNAGDIGADSMEALRKLTTDQTTVGEALADPMESLDQYTVLCRGIVAWSYDAEVTTETIKQLDEKTAQWAALEIIQPQTMEQRKNFSSGSTSHSMETVAPPTNGSSHESVTSSDAPLEMRLGSH